MLFFVPLSLCDRRFLIDLSFCGFTEVVQHFSVGVLISQFNRCDVQIWVYLCLILLFFLFFFLLLLSLYSFLTFFVCFKPESHFHKCVKLIFCILHVQVVNFILSLLLSYFLCFLLSSQSFSLFDVGLFHLHIISV